MDRFELMVGLLRRGLSERATQARAEEPGAWLPRWTAGEPLSRAMRQVHQLGSLITAVGLDDTYAWALVDGAVHRITVADGQVYRLGLEGPHEFYCDAVFDGATVAAVSDDRLLVWDLSTGGRLLATDPDDIPRPAGHLSCLAVGAGVAVAGTECGYLLQWDLRDGARLAKTAAHDGYVGGVAIDTDGVPAVLSFGGEDRSTVSFHDLGRLRHTGEAVMAGHLRSGGWTTLDGQRRAVTVGADGLLTVWDPAAAVPLAQFPAADAPTGALNFTADGAWAVLGDAQVLQVVDLRDGTVHATVRTDFNSSFDGSVDVVAVCGPLLFAGYRGSSEGCTNLLELADPLPHDARHRPHFVDAAAITVDGRPAVITVGRDDLFRVFDATDGRQLGEPLGEHRTLVSPRILAATTAGGRDLVVCMHNLVPRCVDPATGDVRAAPQPSSIEPVLAAAAARDGLVAAVNASGTLSVWEVATLELRASKRVADRGGIITIALGDLHGRPVVLTGADDGVIRWFDSADLTELPAAGRFTQRRSSADHVVNPMRRPGPNAVTALHVAGAVVLSAVADTVTCADIATGEPAGPALVHPGNVQAILPAVLDTTPVVATSCADRVLRIWEIGTGHTIAAVTLPRPVHRIVAVTTEHIIVLDSGYLVAADTARPWHTAMVPAVTATPVSTPGQHTATARRPADH